MVLAGIGALTLLDLLLPARLLLLLAVIAGAYLAPRYGLISSNFGGLFSGGSARERFGSAAPTTPAARPDRQIVHYLAAAMWLLALGAVAAARDARPRADPGILAFSPLILGARATAARLSRLPVLRTVGARC